MEIKSHRVGVNLRGSKMKNPNNDQTFIKIAIEQAKIAEENGDVSIDEL